MTQPTSQKPSTQEPHPLVRIATLEEKVAQLENRLAKLELLQNQPGNISVESSSKGESKNNVVFEVVKINTKVIESNDSWSKFSWKLVIKSLVDKPVKFNVLIKFLDSDGFIVDQTSESNLLLLAQKEETYTGYALVNSSIAGKIMAILSEVTPS